MAWLLLHLFDPEIIAQSSHTQHLHQLVWLRSSKTLTKAGGNPGVGSLHLLNRKTCCRSKQRRNLQTKCNGPENSLGINGSNKNMLLKCPVQTPSVDRVPQPLLTSVNHPLPWGMSQALQDA